MINFLIPNYVKEGKTNLVIAIGCTGGKAPFCDFGQRIIFQAVRECRDMDSVWNTEMQSKDRLLKKHER